MIYQPDGIDEPELADASSSLNETDEPSAISFFELLRSRCSALVVEAPGVGRNAESNASKLKLSSASSIGRSPKTISSCSSDGTSVIIWFGTEGIIDIIGSVEALGSAVTVADGAALTFTEFSAIGSTNPTSSACSCLVDIRAAADIGKDAA
ncbi:hypothetical protein PsorP6_003683 [Peronosclerospora sorghi]|uniref:Uncharacterized protein n=1 Tax=Peronosclerospora sorghi TaxID=230839 RepID=A0ACC0VPG1_9STRA|nr:hypothetical protein PsorP6_003683 [Peronosclerospora sorghi]